MHEPLFQRIHLPGDKSFNVLKVERPHFVVPWHFHPEIEIMLVVKGKGTRLVGDSIEHFEALDLVMVGADLAHAGRVLGGERRRGDGGGGGQGEERGEESLHARFNGGLGAT